MRLDAWDDSGARTLERIDDETLALVCQLMGCNPWRKKWTGWQGPPETATAALREALDAGMRVEFV